MTIQRTPLYATHIEMGAKMVNFHGWEMPLQYGSQIEEHHQVRHDAGVFDVSHMTVVDILGVGGRQFLRKLLANDVDQLEQRGCAFYSCMCNEHGGIIDDLITYQRAPDNYRLVLNSATHEKDLKWIYSKSEGFALGLQERTELAMLAVQGPRAIEKTLSILTPEQTEAVLSLKPFHCVDVGEWFFARTGYTGEDGLEIILPQEEIVDFWKSLVEAGIKPCGLGARDTLRLEAGMLLYGQDMDETTSPLEAGLGWTIKWQPEDRDFIGMGALLSQLQQGSQKKFVGLLLEGKGIMRPGQKVIIQPSDEEESTEGAKEGVITSGSYSPTLAQSVALARVPAFTGEQVHVEIRGKLIPAKVGKPKFVKRGKILWQI